MTKDEEILAVHNAIIHPMGFVLSVLGGMITIHSICVGEETEWQVLWQEILDGMIVDSYKDFIDPLEAARFFIDKMHDMQISIKVD